MTAEQVPKVFCIECNHLSYCDAGLSYSAGFVTLDNGCSIPANSVCKHPKNVLKQTLYSWYREESTISYINPPSMINRGNNCNWFERRSD